MTYDFIIHIHQSYKKEENGGINLVGKIALYTIWTEI